MATYAMSDIHGMYGKYMEMLEKIGFSDKDTLFVLGDVVDRGPEPVRVIQDMMSRPNVFGLMGNHDLFALDMMSRLTKEITEENYDTGIDDELLRQLNAWYSEGGGSTMDGFMSLSPKDRLDAVEYLREFSLYEIIDVGDRTFVMIHAGLGGLLSGEEAEPVFS
ncbi:MAG TPA: fructose-bisphosphatase class III [Ruminococcus sp.]|nr:fructose-bisphosphatase class III [Ruminococcus sp.]